ncbi:MAG: LysR family transcriptional regulator [Burkholderiaceae bacterium]
MKNASIDLELLRLFKTLAETASLSQAADKLGLSPASAQRSLERLRLAFKDRLFLKTSTGMTPTPRAERLLPKVRCALDRIESLVVDENFVPALTRQRFTIGAVGHGVIAIVAKVLPSFLEAAPMARIDIQPLGSDMGERLEDGRLDLIFYGGPTVPPDCHSVPILENGFMLLMRKDHPLTLSTAPGVAPSIGNLEQYRRISIKVRADKERRVLEQTSGSELSQDQIAISTEYFVDGPILLLDNDLITILPTPTALRFQSLGPWAAMPTPWAASSFTVKLAWHHRVHDDPAITWLRKFIVHHTVDLRGALPAADLNFPSLAA